MEKMSFSVKEWAAMVAQNPDKEGNIPIWFRVTGNSMYPFIRANMDDILLVPVKQDELKIGDIVLFPGRYKGGDYCLHRLYQMDGDRVQTFGDGNLHPDGWFPKAAIIGKAVLIQRGRVAIDCEDPRWIKRFDRWNSLWRIRKYLLLPFRIARKLKRVFRLGKTGQISGCI